MALLTLISLFLGKERKRENVSLQFLFPGRGGSQVLSLSPLCFIVATKNKAYTPSPRLNARIPKSRAAKKFLKNPAVSYSDVT